MKTWLKTLFNKRSGSGPVPLLEPMQIRARTVAALAESEARLLDQVESLQEQLDQATHAAEVARERCDHARTAHAALNRRVNDLRVDWPAVHDRYSTKQGIAAREAGVPMNPKRKRK